MGRGRKGHWICSQKQMRPTTKAHLGRPPGYTHIESISLSPQDVEAAKRLTKEQLAYILFKGGNTVSEGTTISSSRTKPCLGNLLFWFCNNLLNIVDF